MSWGAVDALSWFAVAAPGLENVVLSEVSALPGARAVHAVPGGVVFAGTLALGMAANLELRAATRILLRVGEMEARFRSALRAQLGALPFERWLPSETGLRIEVAAHRCRLYHTALVEQEVRAAIAARLGRPSAPSSDQSSGASLPTARILVRGERDRWVVSVDASGELLHRRGWRLEAGRAPLRETLAAGILQLAGYDPRLPLVDPMCGSGTLVLEAAALATGRAPGLGRDFAFQRWPSFGAAESAQWQKLCRAAAAPTLPAAPAAILGLDESAKAVVIASRNAERAGFSTVARFEQTRFEPRPDESGPSRLPAGPGLVVINPPYGKRLGHPAAARRLTETLGQNLPAWFPGWRAAVLVPDAKWAPLLELCTPGLRALDNGGLRVHLVMGNIHPR